MSKKWKWAIVIALLLAVLLAADFIWNGKVSQLWHSFFSSTESSTSAALVVEGDVYQTYTGDVYVDFLQRKLSGSLTVQATNKSTIDQSAIYFHLYPNVFRGLNELRGENWDYVLGEKRLPGWIDIRNVTVNDTQSEFEINNTVMKIPLSKWKSGTTIQIAFDFEIQVPKNNSRFSYDEHSIWLGNWLPIVAEYDDSGWYLDPYYPIGDPFYSDIANYELEINVPAGYRIASSGYEFEQHVKSLEDREQFRVFAPKVRDFALVIMDDTYKNIRQQVGDIYINTWYRDTDQEQIAKGLHEAGVASLRYFSDAYGAYPYKEYDIVRTGGFFGGMEYPGIVFIQGRYFEKQNDYGILVVAHETAHQWWYGIVGNNEVTDPWLDESLAQYSTLRFLLEHYNPIGQYMLKSSERDVAKNDRFMNDYENIGSSVEQFSNWDSYGTLVYNKGLLMFYRLEQAIGLKKMNEILRDYVDQYQFRNATDEGLIQIFTQHLGEQAKKYFESWLQGEIVSFE